MDVIEPDACVVIVIVSVYEACAFTIVINNVNARAASVQEQHSKVTMTKRRLEFKRYRRMGYDTESHFDDDAAMAT